MTGVFPDQPDVYHAKSRGDGVPVAQSGSPITASVISNFSTGFYVQTADGCIFAIGGPQIPAGPIHLVLTLHPPSPKVGSSVRIKSGSMQIGDENIAIGPDVQFRPHLPGKTTLTRVRAIMSELYVPADVPEDISPVFPQLIDALRASDLGSAGHVLQGRGGGSTPTGDDVLAGLLLYQCWNGTSAARLQQIAQDAETTDLSKAFLKWAARGQSISPVHDLIDAADEVVSGLQPRVKLDQTIETIRKIGHSSGTALLTGLGLAACLT